MENRLGGHYHPIRDPRLFPENIARRKMARWREKDRRRKQKEKDKIREKAFKKRVKRSMGEVGIEFESTEEVEDSEEFVILDNENKDLHKISEEQKEMKRS
jgi:hypothetical protein